MDAAPSEAERSSVDALLGPPETGWVGGPGIGAVAAQFFDYIANQPQQLLLLRTHTTLDEKRS